MVRYVLLRSKRRTLRSFTFFSRVFGDLWNPKERYVLFRSFAKNGKERKKQNVLLQRKEKNARTFRSFAKRTGECYVLFSSVTFSFEIYIEIYIDIYRYI